MFSQSILLENLTMVLSLFLHSRWQDSIFFPELLTLMWWGILQTVGSSWSCSTEEVCPNFYTVSTEYCASFQHYCSTELNCLTKASFTFWAKIISGSGALKLRCISLISSVKVFNWRRYAPTSTHSQRITVHFSSTIVILNSTA